MLDSQLKELLLRTAQEDEKCYAFKDDFCAPIISYAEDINPDAINGSAWLKNRTSYIWKVGVLSIFDGNKRDYGFAYIGLQRTNKDTPEYIGYYHFPEGENDDCDRVVKRVLKCLQEVDCVFGERDIENDLHRK